MALNSYANRIGRFSNFIKGKLVSAHIERALLWIVLSGIMLIFCLRFYFLPAEDAYITFRYSQNIQDGYGYVYNRGEKPVYGSTSILFTLVLAVSPISIPIFAQFLNFLFALGIVHIIISQTDALHAKALVGLMTVISTLPGLILAGMDNVLFAFLMLVSILKLRDNSHSVYPLCFLLAMTRPEGALVSLVIILLDIYRNGSNTRLILTLGSLAIAYYSILMIYFGSVLPLPFLYKTKTVSVVWNARKALYYLLNPMNLIPLIFISIDAFDGEWYKLLETILPAALYYAAYIFVNQIQNVILRFHYPITPVLLLLAVPAFVRFIPKPKKEKIIPFVILTGLILSAQYFEMRQYVPHEDTPPKTVRIYIANLISPDSTIASTEAGLIPYMKEDSYVVDLLGLNTPEMVQGFNRTHLELYDFDYAVVNSQQEFMDYFSEFSVLYHFDRLYLLQNMSLN